MIATWIQHQVVIKYCTFNHMHIDTHAMFAISVMDREDTFPITYIDVFCNEKGNIANWSCLLKQYL